MYILLKLGNRNCSKATMLRSGKAYSYATLLASEVELLAIAERLENGVPPDMATAAPMWDETQEKVPILIAGTRIATSLHMFVALTD